MHSHSIICENALTISHTGPTRGPRPQPSHLHVALPANPRVLQSADLSDYTNNLHPVIALLARRRATLRRSTRSTMRRSLHKASTQILHLITHYKEHSGTKFPRTQSLRLTTTLSRVNLFAKRPYDLTITYDSPVSRCLSQRGGVMKPRANYSTNYRQYRWRPPA